MTSYFYDLCLLDKSEIFLYFSGVSVRSKSNALLKANK